MLAIIGDGSMTAGMAFEAMNNAGVYDDINMLVVLNDNDMSIATGRCFESPFGALMSGKFYAAAQRRQISFATTDVGISVASKNTQKAWSPATMFEEFGFNYIGPIDGHDLGIF